MHPSSPAFPRHALSTRARLVLLVTAVLVPVIVFAALLLWQFSAAERARYREDALELSRQVSTAIDNELLGLAAALEALATSPALQPGGDLAAFDAQARAILRTRGTFIAMRDRAGQQVINTNLPFGSALPAATDPVLLAADRQVFETGKPVISDLFTGTTTGLRLVMIDAPVFRDGSVAYALNIALDPARLAETLASSSSSSTWTVAAIDRSDRIIARSRQHERFLGSEATPDLRAHTTGAGGTWLGMTLEGTEVLGAYTRSPLSGWRVAVGVPTYIIQAPLRRLTWSVVASAAMVLALSLALAIWVASGIAGPLRNLTEAARRLGRGHEVPPLATGLREANEVGQALSAASVEIQERQAEERQAKASLAESQARLRAVFEAAPVGLVIAEAPNGHIIEGNAQAERIFRHPIIHSPDIESYGAWVAYHPDGRQVQGHEYPLGRIFTTGEERPEMEALYQRGDGTRAWVRIVGAPIRSDAGELTGAVVAILDIDAERRAEAQLRELNATLEARVEAAVADRDRIWRVSRDLLGVANFEGYLESVNPAWQRVLGWSEEELYRTPYLDFIHPDDLDRTREEVAKLAAGAMTLLFENRYRHKDGSYRWLAWTAVPEAGHIYCVARDVTAEKEATETLRRTEEQLRQSQKMEIVGQLTGGVAHDFNNLLTVVTGHLEMLQKRLEATTADPRLLRNARSAMDGAQRAATLTHRLLAFSRQSPLRPEVIDLNKVVGGMSDLIGRTLGENIAIETVLAAGLWRTEADLNQVESAILNLCINARDAMPGGGKLTIETANAHLDESYPAVARGELKAGQYVMVAVCDTGTGMPPEVRDRVFEPFFTTKPIGKGTGLGLSQVYGFLRQSGGQACIYSEVGEGTVVRLYFPRLRQSDEAKADEAARPPSAAPEGCGQTILVVEDESMVREFTISALEEAGYTVLAAPDGPSGLALLDAHPEIVLLFTDVVLAGPLNGRKVADEALRRRPNLKVLFTTGYTRNAIVHHGRLDEDVELITKPFTATGLTERIRRLLENP